MTVITHDRSHNLISKTLLTAINNLKKWMKPESVKGDIANKLATCQIRKQPYGVSLIIGAWNFPFALVVAPLIGAIAAGKDVSQRTCRHARNSGYI